MINNFVESKYNCLFKYITAISLILILNNYAAAQDNGKGKISGIVSDKDNNTLLSGAAVKLISQSDTSFFKGTETNSKGMFSVEIPFGKYIAEVNMVGHNTMIIKGMVL